MIDCFLVHETNEAALYLRRYVTSDKMRCSGPDSYHNAMNYFGKAPIQLDASGCWSGNTKLNLSHDYPLWPTHCACGYEFEEGDSWQDFHDRIYTDGTKEWAYRELPVGAMFFVGWLPDNMFWDNLTGGHLHVLTPGGWWNIDGRASNCTLPDDKLHRCWIRHGEAPMIHVDKNGISCAAGAGSILQGNYHGFLHHGKLT